MSEARKPRPIKESDLIARVRAAARQEQFLEVVSAGEVRIRFEQHLDLAPLPAEAVSLADARTRVLAHESSLPSMRPHLTARMLMALPYARLTLSEQVTGIRKSLR